MKSDLANFLLSGNLILALPIAALAGLISFASPCVIPLVPGYLTYAAGFSKSRGKLFLGSLLFVSGISYFGFLGAPPTIGYIADAITLRWAMLIPAALAIFMAIGSRFIKHS